MQVAITLHATASPELDRRGNEADHPEHKERKASHHDNGRKQPPIGNEPYHCPDKDNGE
jgi:hypothetical protein